MVINLDVVIKTLIEILLTKKNKSSVDLIDLEIENLNEFLFD
jgi:hypothetical protein